MVKGLYTAYTGMIDQQNRMDVMTNNLANADTNGYKKEGATTQSFDSELMARIRDKTTMHYADRIGTMNLGVKIGECYTNYDQGSFKTTENTYDLALAGNGFFAISFTNKAGETSMKLTRDGAFSITEEGYLVTKDGDYVLNQAAASSGNPGAAGYIQIDPLAETTIDRNGNIYQNDTLVGTIGVVDVEDYNYLAKYGENMYELTDGGTLTDSTAQVRQGYIEASNVNIVDEMVEMIVISRAYESDQKLIQTIDGMLDKAVNDVGKV
jgi:flagellar basal-body rod protein FlgG